MKSLIAVAQDIQRLSYKEYPGIGVPFIDPLVKLLYAQDEDGVKKFIYDNNHMMTLYPAIYKYLKKELDISSEMPEYDYIH
jgi:hypothetical protein